MPTIKILWFVATLVNGQPTQGPMEELTTFKTMEECEAFAVEMAPRVQDYIRGYTKQEWSTPVHVQHKCFVPGQAA